jgi:hypothetical protein
MEQLETMCATVPSPDESTLARARARVLNVASESTAIPASEITVRHTKPRARRRLVAVAAGCAAAGLAVALTLAPGSRGNSARPGPAHAQLAAWTVRTNPGGTVTFTLRNTSHPAQLQRALAKAGVPAVVRWGKICEAGGPGQPLMGGDEASFMTNGSAMDAGSGPFFATLGGQGTNPDLNWSWTLIPSKIPHGGHFVISAMPGPVPASDFQAVWEFAKTSAPITCATHVDK